MAETINNCSEQVLGVKKRNHRDWFDEGRADVAELLEERNNLIKKYLSNPTNLNHAALSDCRSRVQREMRAMQNRWWASFAAEVQQHADTGSQQGFYSAIKAVCGPRLGNSHPIRSSDGTLLTEKLQY